MVGEIKMGEMFQLKKSTKSLCTLFDTLGSVKNERQLLNLIYFAQEEGIMDDIYSDFNFSDLGPFSSQIDLDLELLKMDDFLYETEDPKNTIYLTSRGKSQCIFLNETAQVDSKLNILKNMDVEELIDINRFKYLQKKFGLKVGEYDKLREYYKLNDERIERLNKNLNDLKILSI